MDKLFKKPNIKKLRKVLIILHIYIILQMLFVFLTTSYEGSISTFIDTISIISEKLYDLIGLDLFIGIFIACMALVFRLRNYIVSFVLASDSTEESYGIKHKILTILGMLALPFWMVLILNTAVNFCDVFTDNIDNSTIKFIVLFVFGVIPSLLIAISTIIMDIMGLCYKSQKKKGD